jgi:hypothetical protein
VSKVGIYHMIWRSDWSETAISSKRIPRKSRAFGFLRMHRQPKQLKLKGLNLNYSALLLLNPIICREYFHPFPFIKVCYLI